MRFIYTRVGTFVTVISFKPGSLPGIRPSPLGRYACQLVLHMTSLHVTPSPPSVCRASRLKWQFVHLVAYRGILGRSGRDIHSLLRPRSAIRVPRSNVSSQTSSGCLCSGSVPLMGMWHRAVTSCRKALQWGYCMRTRPCLGLPSWKSRS